MSRLEGAVHPFGLCRLVHLAGEPCAADCIACRARSDPKALCSTCEKQARAAAK